MQEAENSMHRLVELVEGLVVSNTNLRIRLDTLVMDHASALAPTSAMISAESSTSSASFAKASRPFEEDLNRSRVYRNLRSRPSLYSISSSRRGSMALSAFSDLMLGNISIISLLCLPAWSCDLSNSSHYRFGKEGLVLTINELAEKYPDLELPELNADGNWSIKEEKQGEEQEGLRIIFMAAGLFQFNITRLDRLVAGYPCLVYDPGEIFDVVGLKGELWLARNQDDAVGTLGWIWEKHFARLLPDGSEEDSLNEAEAESLLQPLNIPSRRSALPGGSGPLGGIAAGEVCEERGSNTLRTDSPVAKASLRAQFLLDSGRLLALRKSLKALRTVPR